MIKKHRFKETGDTIILYPDNYINDIEGEKLEELCDAFIKKGYTRIVIDFSGTDIINSIGISILIGIIEKIRDKKGVISFSGLKKVNYDIFSIVGLTKQIPVFRTEDDALVSPASGGNAAI